MSRSVQVNNLEAKCVVFRYYFYTTEAKDARYPHRHVIQRIDMRSICSKRVRAAPHLYHAPATYETRLRKRDHTRNVKDFYATAAPCNQ